jgi:hypothetical protein
MYQDAVASCKGKGFITIRPEVMLGEGRFTRSCDGLSYDKQEITSFIEPTFIDTTVTKTKPSRKTKKKDLKEEEITQ